MKIKDMFGRPYPLDHVLMGVGPGWREIVQCLIDDLFEMGWDGELLQIKEKFGGLRFYTGRTTEEMFARIAQAENESFQTCDQCGEPGKPRNDNYWVATLCDRCHEKESNKDL